MHRRQSKIKWIDFKDHGDSTVYYIYRCVSSKNSTKVLHCTQQLWLLNWFSWRCSWQHPPPVERRRPFLISMEATIGAVRKPFKTSTNQYKMKYLNCAKYAKQLAKVSRTCVHWMGHFLIKPSRRAKDNYSKMSFQEKYYTFTDQDLKLGEFRPLETDKRINLPKYLFNGWPKVLGCKLNYEFYFSNKIF